MTEAKQKASGVFMRQSIQEMKGIQQGNYSMHKHNRKLYLEEKAEQYFDLYKNDNLLIEQKDGETFAAYINCFGGVDTEELFDKLQNNVDFDVRESVLKSKRSWWQKLWHKEEYAYLNTSKLVRKINRFQHMRRVSDQRGYHGIALVNRLRQMGEEALDYIEAYNNGRYHVKQEDMAAFVSYVKALGEFYDGSPAEKALNKLMAENKATNEQPAKVVHMSAQPTKKRSFWKRAAVAAVLVVGGWFGFNSDSNSKEPANISTKPTTDLVKLPSASKFAMPKLTDYSVAQFTPAPIQKMTTVTPVQQKQETKSSVPQDLIKFHTKRLSGWISADKAQKRIDIMAEKVKEGIISMPADISIQNYLYAQEVYRRYGFKKIASEFGSALKADQKISAEQQNKLFEYVRKAGKKGWGVKKMSDQVRQTNLLQWKRMHQRA